MSDASLDLAAVMPTSWFPTFPPTIRQEYEGRYYDWCFNTRDESMSYMPTIMLDPPAHRRDSERLIFFFGIGQEWNDTLSLSWVRESPHDLDLGWDGSQDELIDSVSFTGLEREDGVLWTRPRVFGAVVQLAMGVYASLVPMIDLLLATDMLYAYLLEGGCPEFNAYRIG